MFLLLIYYPVSHLLLTIINRVEKNSFLSHPFGCPSQLSQNRSSKMEKENCQVDADSTAVCEKIYSAVAGNHVFKAIHGKSGRSQSPMAAITDTNQPGIQTTKTVAKTNVPAPLQKPVAHQKAGFPGEVNIPIELGPSMATQGKEKMPIQNSNRVTISPVKIDPSGHSTTKKDTPKPVSQKPTTVIVHIEGHLDDVVLPEAEKLKATIASGNGQFNKVAPKKEAKPEKASSPNIIVIQGHGQGINAPQMSKQEEEAKPKVHAAAIAKTLSTKNDQPTVQNKGDQEGKKSDHSTVNDKFSNYITRVRNKMRTPSNVTEESLNASQYPRLATRQDSFNDKVVNYITRARKNIRTTSNVGDA